MDILEIRKVYEIFKHNSELIEIRAIDGNKILSGYFDNVDTMISELNKIENSSYQIYFVLNKINDACKSRTQFNKLMVSSSTTTDNDIDGRTWFFIDIDPIRPSGVSATDNEKENAKECCKKVFRYLDNLGFEKPIMCDSGNGFHLLYAVSIINNKENTELIKDVLKCLNFLFSNDKVDIDTSVYNPARIVKLYGTEAKKGASTKDRPFRQSSIIYIPEHINLTPIVLIQKITNLFPKLSIPSYKNNYNGVKFDLAGWIKKFSIDVDKVIKNEIGTKYILKHCIFDSNHINGSAMIFQMASGTIGYKCLHASCQDKTWKDVRLKYEPNAYSRYSDFKRSRDTSPISRNNNTNGDNKKIQWLCTSDIVPLDRTQITSIPSGFIELDKAIIGFNLGEVSVWSGNNGSGKSSILNQIALTTAEKGFKTAIFSGEMAKQQMKNWIILQAAGKQFTRESPKYPGVYYVPKELIPFIDKWLKDKIYIYDNDSGNNINDLLDAMSDLVQEQKIDQFILDNLMAIDLADMGKDIYQEQKQAILAITDFAKKYNVHIHVVCHPRKSLGFLRKTDISGTADLTNAAHNVFIVHRVNNDFKNNAKEFFSEITAKSFYNYDNVIEVCKNRDLGVMDKLIGLYYEVQSKRFLNTAQEDNLVFDWQDDYNNVNDKKNLTQTEIDNLPF